MCSFHLAIVEYIPPLALAVCNLADAGVEVLFSCYVLKFAFLSFLISSLMDVSFFGVALLVSVSSGSVEKSTDLRPEGCQVFCSIPRLGLHFALEGSTAVLSCP